MDQEFELQELSGTVETVIYRNEDNGYTVLRLRDGNGETVTVVGTFPYAASGETMIISGTWTNHSVHGRQFKETIVDTLWILSCLYTRQMMTLINSNGMDYLWVTLMTVKLLTIHYTPSLAYNRNRIFS